MRIRNALLLALLGDIACRSPAVSGTTDAPKPPDAPGTESAPVATPARAGEFAVALETTPLRERPDAASGHSLAAPWDGTGVVVRIVDEQDGMLAVEPWVRIRSARGLAPEDAMPTMIERTRSPEDPRPIHCAEQHDGFSGVRLRFWVRPEELAEVVLRRVERTYPDGTSVTVRPGAVVTSRNALAMVESLDANVELELRNDEIGRRYDPDSAPLRAYVGEIERGRGPTLGVGTFDVPVLDREEGSFVRVNAPLKDGRTRMGDNCIEAVVDTDAEQLRPDDGVWTDEGPIGALAAPNAVAPKTALVWPDGTPAGETTAALAFHEGETVGERVCFEPYGVDAGPPIVVCAPKGSIRD